MSMVKLFNNLAVIEEELTQSPLNLTEEQLCSLDSGYDDAWNAILNYEPSNGEMAELMLLMLLDKLEAMARRGESCAKVREKVLALFEIQVDRARLRTSALTDNFIEQAV